MDNIDDQDGLKAYEAIQHQLNAWTSPSVTSASGNAGGGSGGYLDRDDNDPTDMDTSGDWDRSTSKLLLSAKKKIPKQQSSSSFGEDNTNSGRETPIVSNSARKLRKSGNMPTPFSLTPASTGAGSATMNDDDDVMSGIIGIQSPPLFTGGAKKESSATMETSTPGSSTAGGNEAADPYGFAATMPVQGGDDESSSGGGEYEYRRYYDALLTYLNGRRNISERIRIQQEENELSRGATVVATTNAGGSNNNNTSSIEKEEDRIELDFLTMLSALCIDRSSSMNIGISTGDSHSATAKSSESPDVLESNVWSLLAELRRIGLDSLLFDSSSSSSNQTVQRQQIESSLQQIALQNIDRTPAEVIDIMYSDNNDDHDHGTAAILVPLVLRRRKVLLDWIEQCNEQALSSNSMKVPSSSKTVMWPASLARLEQERKQQLPKQPNKVTTLHPDAPLLIQEQRAQQQSNNAASGFSFASSSSSSPPNVVNPLFGNDEQDDTILLSACLSLILAGRLDEAMDLCRSTGQSWRCAAWGGGTPHGIVHKTNDATESIDIMRVGNPNRFLWKRQCWNLSQTFNKKQQQLNNSSSLAIDGTSRKYEGVIYALLSNDIKSALTNSALMKGPNRSMNGDVSSSSLSPWEYGLTAILSCMIGRYEDELLHYHNNTRRGSNNTGAAVSHNNNDSIMQQRFFPYPGTKYINEEIEQLQCTSNVSSMVETDMFQLLSSSLSSFATTSIALSAQGEEDATAIVGGQLQQQNPQDHPLREAMTSFIIGKNAISQYIEEEGLHMGVGSDITHLRFLTHLTLYLDSLLSTKQLSPEPQQGQQLLLPLQEGNNFDMIKNNFLLQYVRYLASRSDLWRMLALYASLLPRDTLLECYPIFLSRVDNNTDRHGMIKDIRDLLPPNLDLVILRKVVRMLILSPGADQSRSTGTRIDDGVAGGNDCYNEGQNDDDEKNDIHKMKSINWLCYYEEHMGDALICTNMLFRQFLLTKKLHCAFVFVEQFLPNNIYETVLLQQQDKERKGGANDLDGQAMAVDVALGTTTSTVATVTHSAMVRNAIAEFGAHQCYLEAQKSYEDWKKLLSKTSPIATGITKHDYSSLTKPEVKIAQSMDRRETIRQKRAIGATIIEAAEVTRAKLMDVLQFPGGFLSIDDDSSEGATAVAAHEGGASSVVQGENEKLRRELELATLRSDCLPRAVFMLHDTCNETATWMSQFLEDGLPLVGKTRSEVLSAIDDIHGDGSNEDSNSSDVMLASPLSPIFWLKHALSLVETVADDAYCISDSFGPNEMKRFLDTIAETSIRHLQFSHDEMEKQ